MYKRIFFGLAVIAGLASCNGDYKDWANPQSNEEVSSTVSASVAGVSSPIVLTSASGDSTAIFNSAEVVGDQATDWKAVVTAKGVVGGVAYTLYPNSDGKVKTEDLNNAVYALYNHVVEARALSVSLTCNVKQAGVSIPVDVTSYDMTVTPMESEYPEALYLIGNAQGWDFKNTVKLESTGTKGCYSGIGKLDGGFKFSKAADWNHGDYGYSYFKSVGEFTSSDDGNLVCNTPGTYNILVNLPEDKVEATLVSK